MSAMDFADDVAVITGAGRGLGREYALAFARRGAAVVVNDPGIETSEDGTKRCVADDVVAEIQAFGGTAIADTNSVATPDGAKAIVQAAMAAFGRLTILVNNAGIISFAPLPEITDAAWRAMQSVTLDGTFFMCRAAWPIMASQGYGRIVNTTSNAGFAGNETLAAYAAAKLGVAGLTKALAQEAIDTGITINAIAPMAVTRMNRDAFFGGADSSGSSDWRQDIAEGRIPMGPPDIVAPTILWLAHRSSTINGEIFSSSSGKVARVGFVVGEGYFNPHHTVEELANNEGSIRDICRHSEPKCTTDELSLIPPLFDA